jgi:putative phosphoribosyl transferase
MNRTRLSNGEDRLVSIGADGATLEGNLGLVPNARGVVLFAHGSGSSRHSARNRYVAEVLRQGGLAMLLLDLLTKAEEEIDLSTARFRFDIGLLAERLIDASDWLAASPETQALPIGYFGAGRGSRTPGPRGRNSFAGWQTRPGWFCPAQRPGTYLAHCRFERRRRYKDEP